jgi:hypothetical protein
MASELAGLRTEYHRVLCREILGVKSDKDGRDVCTIADISSHTSREIAKGIAERIGHPFCKSPKVGQTAGRIYGEQTLVFLQDAFALLTRLRPGEWTFSASQAGTGIAAYDQYEHLAVLSQLTEENPQLAASLGFEYMITPDIVVGRSPIEDSEINAAKTVIAEDDSLAGHTPMRKANCKRPILHASVSCKWTIRSDRAQNTRTEALNLIRNRKGNTPHIVVATFEPLPTRLASIALGTGDVDCTYHSALYELYDATKAGGFDDQLEMLDTLINGRRLRDISDLPFDLAV